MSDLKSNRPPLNLNCALVNTSYVAQWKFGLVASDLVENLGLEEWNSAAALFYLAIVKNSV